MAIFYKKRAKTTVKEDTIISSLIQGFKSFSWDCQDKYDKIMVVNLVILLIKNCRTIAFFEKSIKTQFKIEV